MKETIAKFEALLQQNDFRTLRAEIGNLRSAFRRQSDRWLNIEQNEFIKKGGKIEEFVRPENPYKAHFEELMQAFVAQKETYLQERKEAAIRRAEVEKQRKETVARKMETQAKLRDELKVLVEGGNQDATTFEQVKAIQQQWNQLGRVTEEAAKAVQLDFHYWTEMFFHNRKIVNQLRDVEYGKNLLVKQELLKKMEQLSEITTIDKVATSMKKYHTEWKATGPVPRGQHETINEKYRQLADIIYGRINEYFDGRRDEREQNLKAKIALCEKVQAIIAAPPSAPRDWQPQTDAVIQLQKEWKTVGISEDNEAIWQVFRGLCDTFFNNRRNFFDQLNVEKNKNKKRKEELCQKAEAVKEDTNWQKTTNLLIGLQKEWKKIGPAPRQDENTLWERFRGACDAFFDAKKLYFSSLDEVYERNLVEKEALIERIKAFEPTENVAKDFEQMRAFSKEWAAIGFVPMSAKDSIYKTYSEALDTKYDQLKANRTERKSMMFQSRIDTLLDTGGGDETDRLVRRERTQLRNRIDTLEGQVRQYENNLGFFRNAKSTNPLVKEINDNIKRRKREIADLKMQLKMLAASAKKQQETPAEEV